MREKKKLTDEQIVSIVVDSEAEIAGSQEQLRAVVGDLAAPDWLVTGVKKGYYSVRDVALDGEPMYRYFFHVNDQGLLHLNAALFIGAGENNFPLFVLGAEKIAKELGARGVQICTRRRGGIFRARQVGYKVDGVLLTKIL